MENSPSKKKTNNDIMRMISVTDAENLQNL